MSNRPATPGPSKALSLASALDQSATLTSLLQRLNTSRELFAAVTPLLPAGLHGDVRPGPLDGPAWSLLASNGAAAAKLRQLLPQLMDTVRSGGWQVTSIAVRVQPRTGP